MSMTATSSPPVFAGYRVETLDDFASFLRIESVWDELVERSGISFPFATHEWVRTWLECFGAGQRIHVLLVKAGRTVVGIAPLLLRRGWMYGLPVTRMQAIHNVYSERFDFIIHGSREEVYPTIWNHLLTRSPHWDVLELRQLPADSPTLPQLIRLADADHYPTEIWHSGNSPYISLNGSWESYSRTLGRRHRSNLRNRLGRLSRMGVVDVEVIESAEEAERALAEGFSLEAAAWKGRAGTAIGCLPRVRAFYESFAHRTARRGWLRLHFLRIDGRRIAFCYGLCFHNRMFALKTGYDPRYAAYSPSMTLWSMMIEEAFRRGREEIDFLGVDDEWKRLWTPTSRPHDWLFVFRPGLRSELLRWAKFRVAPLLRRVARST